MAQGAEKKIYVRRLRAQGVKADPERANGEALGGCADAKSVSRAVAQGAEKKPYARQRLQAQGVKANPERVDAMIEATVLALA